MDLVFRLLNFFFHGSGVWVVSGSVFVSGFGLWGESGLLGAPDLEWVIRSVDHIRSDQILIWSRSTYAGSDLSGSGL